MILNAKLFFLVKWERVNWHLKHYSFFRFSFLYFLFIRAINYFFIFFSLLKNVLSVTFVRTSFLLWIRFTGRTCYFIIIITHNGVCFRWCCTWHWFCSGRLMPISIGYELFLWWFHCTVLACVCILWVCVSQQFYSIYGIFLTVLNSSFVKIFTQ